MRGLPARGVLFRCEERFGRFRGFKEFRRCEGFRRFRRCEGFRGFTGFKEVQKFRDVQRGSEKLKDVQRGSEGSAHGV
jgi:hypothetical protein